MKKVNNKSLEYKNQNKLLKYANLLTEEEKILVRKTKKEQLEKLKLLINASKHNDNK